MKKLSALIICLLMIVTCGLAGCATFSINKVKYYNEVLATVGDKNITRFEVLNAYASYGNSYFVQQEGKSESEAIESTLDLLIDRESLYQYALTENKFKPTDRQVNEIIEEIFTSMDTQMEGYVSTSKSILNIKTVENESEATTNNKVYKLSDYEYSARAKIVPYYIYYTNAEKTTVSSTVTQWYDLSYKIKYQPENVESWSPVIDDTTYLADHTKEGIITVIKDKYFDNFHKNLVETEKVENVKAIETKAINLFVKDLLNYEYYLRDENGKPYNKLSEDLIYRYFERTFESKIKDQYLENVRIDFLENETLSVTDIMYKFDSKLRTSHSAYANRPTIYKNKMKDIGTDGDTVLYHPNLTDGTKFGYFIHTLLNLSETQKTALKNLDKEDAYYDEDLATLLSEIKVDYRNDQGEVAGSESFVNVITEYQNNVVSQPSYESKMQAFIKFMFKYSGDTATLSQGMPYVVGTNGFSGMVENFTKESIKLMEQGKGSVSNVDLQDIDSFCLTEYGIHLVFFVDDVNAYDFNYESKDLVKIQDLVKTLNPLTGETYFDMLFDEVYPAGSGETTYSSNTGYAGYENIILNDFKANNRIVKYTTKIKATKTTLN